MANKAVVTQTTLDEIAHAIIAKGGATGPMTPTQMPEAIMAIEGGGNDEEWQQPSDWPDVKPIYDLETAGLQDKNAVIVLFDVTYKRNIVIQRLGNSGRHAASAKDCAGREVGSTSGDVTITIPDDALIPGRDTGSTRKYAWVLFRGVSDVTIDIYYGFGVAPWLFVYGGEESRFVVGSLTGPMPSIDVGTYEARLQHIYYRSGSENLFRCRKLIWMPNSSFLEYQNPFYPYRKPGITHFEVGEIVYPEGSYRCFLHGFKGAGTVIKVLKIGGVLDSVSAYLGFSGCASLRAVPDVLDLSACTNCNQMFSGCASLRAVPDVLDISACTNCNQMFSGCSVLENVPDVIDLASCTSCNQMFDSCYNVSKLPTHLTANGDNSLKISFSDFNGGKADGMFMDSLAVIENGTVIGGMAYNINDLTGSEKPPTVTFNGSVKTAFGSDWEIVKQAFTSKGWNISPA